MEEDGTTVRDIDIVMVIDILAGSKRPYSI